MKKRKERIEQEKALQLTENFKSVKKATTYIGTTVLMGTAGIGLSKTKAMADTTVQVANGQKNGQNNQSQETVNNQITVQSDAGQDNAQNTITTENNETSVESNNEQAKTTQDAQQETATDQQNQNEEPQKAVPSKEAPVISGNTNSLLRGSVTTYQAPQSFIAQIAPSAVQIAKQRGLYASMMIAQASLESGWGSSQLSSQAFNLFGVKWNGSGAFVQMPTNEHYQGSNHRVTAKFQKYGSYGESMNNYATMILNRFPNSTPGKVGSVEQATKNLSHGVYGTYATDPNYAATLMRIINMYGLKQYDSQVGNNGGNTSTNLPNANSGQNSRPDHTSTGSNTSTSNHATYTVKAGDNLYQISLKHNMSVAKLKNLNNLSSNNIYVGQKLKVSGSTTNNNAKPQPSKPSKPSDPSKPSQTYTVKAKDSLWSIAQKNKTSVANLRKLNNLKADIIYVGQKLKVTAGSTAKQPSGNTSRPSKAQQRPANTPKQTSYTVKAHDSLWSIAHSHGLSVAQVKSLNNLSSDLIRVGQKLNLSKKQSGHANSNQSRPNNNKNNNRSNQTTKQAKYTVQSGDSLWSIAQRNNMSVSSLKSLNKLSSDMIVVGQKLQVKGNGQKGQTNNSNKDKTIHKKANGTYVVKKNDSLWSIANAHNITIAKLRSINHLTGSVIYIGQTLKVEGRASVNAEHKNSSSAPKKSTYTVQAHDSLWRIATRNKMTVNQLKSMNHLVSDAIYVGQTLKLK